VALLVADIGPLIALARLDLLWLPERLERQVQIPASVGTEVTRAPRGGDLPRLQAARETGWLAVVPAPQVLDPRLASAAMHDGELAAMGVALQLGAPVLMDELRGRAVASRLGLDVVGTLGLLLRARESGHVGPMRPLIDALQRGGYYLSPRLVQQVLATAGE
jgi:predicted nucleic acid-binding protein